MPIRDLLERDGLIFGKKIKHLHTYGSLIFFLSLKINEATINKIGQFEAKNEKETKMYICFFLTQECFTLRTQV